MLHLWFSRKYLQVRATVYKGYTCTNFVPRTKYFLTHCYFSISSLIVEGGELFPVSMKLLGKFTQLSYHVDSVDCCQ